MIVIIDYGMGNVGSIQNMIKKIGENAIISKEVDVINQASKIILPGVGAYDTAMEKISSNGLLDILNKKAYIDKIPILGICLGMQLLTNGSEEGKLPGLGWIPGFAKKFNFTDSAYKVPHMGWNRVVKTNFSPLTQNFTHEYRFYHVHSYYIQVEQEIHSILKTTYGITFDSGIQKDNIMGVQFHPEKSHTFGMHLMKNFVSI